VVRDGKRLTPTDTGILVNDLIVEHFPDILDVGFTARMEEDLDKIAEGDESWVEVIREFYTPFEKEVQLAEEKMPEFIHGPEPIGRQAGMPNELVTEWGLWQVHQRQLPECRHTEATGEDRREMPQDGGEIVERKTRKGLFLWLRELSNYDLPPEAALPKPCPECGGLLVVADKRNAQCLKCEERFPLDEVATDEAVEEAA
jgi:DNA topoisomerase-1